MCGRRIIYIDRGRDNKAKMGRREMTKIRKKDKRGGRGMEDGSKEKNGKR